MPMQWFFFITNAWFKDIYIYMLYNLDYEGEKSVWCKPTASMSFSVQIQQQGVQGWQTFPGQGWL